MSASATTAAPQRGAGINQWDSPWLNGKFLTGLIILVFSGLMGIVGGLFWGQYHGHGCVCPNKSAPDLG